MFAFINIITIFEKISTTNLLGMKIKHFLLALICGVLLLSCSKATPDNVNDDEYTITNTLAGTKWVSSLYEAYLYEIEFMSDSGFLYTTYAGVRGNGFYQFENPNFLIYWLEGETECAAEGYVDGRTLILKSIGGDSEFIFTRQ